MSVATRAVCPSPRRRDSVGYPTSKFVRRHAIGVTATALVLLSLIGGLIGMAWQARVASREAAKAREVSRFLSSLFAVADPARTNAADITALDLLNRGATRIDDRAGRSARCPGRHAVARRPHLS